MRAWALRRVRWLLAVFRETTRSAFTASSAQRQATTVPHVREPRGVEGEHAESSAAITAAPAGAPSSTGATRRRGRAPGYRVGRADPAHEAGYVAAPAVVDAHHQARRITSWPSSPGGARRPGCSTRATANRASISPTRNREGKGGSAGRRARRNAPAAGSRLPAGRNRPSSGAASTARGCARDGPQTLGDG